MKNLLSLMMVLGVLFLASCGSGGSSGSSSGVIVGASLILSSPLAIDETLPKQGELTISADVTDENGDRVADGTPVYFTASAGTITHQASTLSGRASATFRAPTLGGSVIVNAGTELSVDGVLGGLVDEYQLTVASGPAAQISLVSITPAHIALRGTGENEIGTFVFSVTDAVGGPVQDGQVVYFDLDSPTGGAEFVSDSSATTINGEVSVSVISGTVSGVATVTASTVSDLGTIATESRITMGSSQPDNLHLGFAAERLNIPGLITFGLENTITAYVADRYSNPVPEGTPVYFAGECGIVSLTDINGVATNTTNRFGQATATAVTAQPTDDLCRYIYWTEGQEAYTDLNGNGQYDPGEPHQGQGEPYIDANDNGAYDSDETYFDLDQNGVYTPNDYVWSGDTFIWNSMNIRWSSTVAQPQFAANDFSLYYGEPLEIEYSATDVNGNPLPSGTAISVSSDCPGVDLSGDVDFTLADMVSAPTDYAVTLSVSEVPDSGDYGSCSVTVEVTGASSDNNGSAATTIYGNLVQKISNFSGEGDGRTANFTLDSDRTVEFNLRHTGSGDFIVLLKKTDDAAFSETLAELNGDYLFSDQRFLATGHYYLDIQAGGTWSGEILGF